MPNHCYCGRSQTQPYCDGSHDGRDRSGAAPAPEPKPSRAPTAEPARPARKGWLARLFGWN